MMNNHKKTEGVIVPVITPVDSQERVDRRAFTAVIDRCIGAGVNGIFVGGSAGMGPLLGEDQWKVMVQTACEHVGDRCVLFAGVISPSTARAIDQIRFLERCGCRYMVVTPTYYITLSREEQFLTHFKACKEATDLEMVVYNIPSCTYSSIPLTVLETLAEQGLFRIMKESSGDREYFSRVMGLGQRYGLTVLQGNEPDIEWGLTLGAGGLVPVCANYEPQTFVAAWKAARQGGIEQLRALQERIDFIRDRLLVRPEHWIAGIMYGLATLGMGSGKPMSPLQEISRAAKEQIDALTGSKAGREVLHGIG